MRNIGVIFGGVNCEHDISIITAMQVVQVLKEEYSVIPIYITKQGNWVTGDDLVNISAFNNDLKTKDILMSLKDNWLYIKKIGGYRKWKQLDFAFLCLHGKNGEDGAVSALLELNNIPYANSSIMGSAVSTDKVAFKDMMKCLKIPMVKSLSFNFVQFKENEKSICQKITNSLKFPIIIKPANLGSSIGIEICKNKKELVDKLISAFSFDNRVLVEEYLDGCREINVAIFKQDNKLIVSEIEEPIRQDNILSFEDKYNSEEDKGMQNLKRIMPAEILPSQKKKIISYAKIIYNALDLFGICRFDFILDSEGKVFVNEVNTIPGSYAFYLYRPKKIDFEKLLHLQIDEGVKRNIKKANLISTFNSNILSGFSFGNKTGKL